MWAILRLRIRVNFWKERKNEINKKLTKIGGKEAAYLVVAAVEQVVLVGVHFELNKFRLMTSADSQQQILLVKLNRNEVCSTGLRVRLTLVVEH